MMLVDMIQVVLVTLILSVSAVGVISMVFAPFFMNRKDSKGEYLTKR